MTTHTWLWLTAAQESQCGPSIPLKLLCALPLQSLARREARMGWFSLPWGRRKIKPKEKDHIKWSDEELVQETMWRRKGGRVLLSQTKRKSKGMKTMRKVNIACFYCREDDVMTNKCMLILNTCQLNSSFCFPFLFSDDPENVIYPPMIPVDLWAPTEGDTFPDPWNKTEAFIEGYCGYSMKATTAHVFFLTPQLAMKGDIRPLYSFKPYVFSKCFSFSQLFTNHESICKLF